jgi:tryptophanyl-tRNA synthetase
MLIAVGLDPDVCTLFVQSDVPYHAQLSWLLECVASFGELSRMTQFKEKAERQVGYRAGLFTYPVLMAADILLYEAAQVPVGDDQRQHLELTREIAERFNNRYGETFVIPEGVQPAAAARVMDLQEPTRKMSKSISSPLGSIFIFEDPSDISKKIMKAVTDTDGEMRYDWDAKPGLANLLEIFAAITDETPQRVADRYTRYGDLKKDLAEAVTAHLAPLRSRYLELLSDPGTLDQAAARGARKAAVVAEATYQRAAHAMGL